MPSRLDICGASDGFTLLAAADNGDGKRLRKFSITAYTGVELKLAGFPHPVVVDLKGLSVPSQQRPILFAHDEERIVGHSDAIAVDDKVTLGGVISGIGEDAKKIEAMADNGFPWQASIGASLEEVEFLKAGQKATVNGRTFAGPKYIARKTTLREVSLLPFGADAATEAKIAATAAQIKGEATMDFDTWLTEKGFDKSALSETAIAFLQKEYDDMSSMSAKAKPAKTDIKAKAEPSSMDAILATARAEEARKQRITELVAQAVTEQPDMIDAAEAIGRLAIEGKWDIQRTELEFLRASRSKVPIVFSRSTPQVTGKVIEAAVCRAGNLENIEKHYDEKTLQASAEQWKNGLGISELILHHARRNGHQALSLHGNLESVLRAAFREDDRSIKAAGPSTYSLPGILSNVANKFLKAGFEYVEAEWRKISAIRSVRDFKQISSYTLTGNNTYKLVPPGGQIDHGTLSEETYTNRIDTRGLMLGIDRRDLINDDVGALSSAGRRLGRGGALALNNAFWAEFIDNLTFFTAARGNFDDGSDSILDADGLESANILFHNLDDPDGEPLGSSPRILLVPRALEGTALRLMNSEVTTEVSALGSANIWRNRFQVVVSDYLTSATKWYLLADPNDIPVIETAFLNGVQSPVVENADMDFDRLGISMRGYFDFGCQLQEWRGGVGMAGA